MSCSNNSFSTGHKCRSSKVNIRLSIDGFHDQERFYRRRTRTCRLLPVFSVFNGPSARPDLRRSSFPRVTKLPSLVERMREREKKETLALRAFRTFVSLRVRRSFRVKSRRRFRLRVCRSLDRILHLITRTSRRFLAMSRKGGEWECHIFTMLHWGQDRGLTSSVMYNTRAHAHTRIHIYIGNNIWSRHQFVVFY